MYIANVCNENDSAWSVECAKGDNFECLSQHTHRSGRTRASPCGAQSTFNNNYLRTRAMRRAWMEAMKYKWADWKLGLSASRAPLVDAHRSNIFSITFPAGKKNTLVSSVERQEFLGDEWKREAVALECSARVGTYTKNVCARHRCDNRWHPAAYANPDPSKPFLAFYQ